MARGQLGHRGRATPPSSARWNRETGHGQEGASAYPRRSRRGWPRRHRATPGRSPPPELSQAEAQGDSIYAAQCRSVLGLAELSVDDPAAALRWLDPVADMLQDGGHRRARRHRLHPRSDRGVGGHRPAGPRRRPAGLAAGRGAAAGPPVGADHRRPRRSRPAARRTRPRRRHPSSRRGHPRSARARAPVRARPLPPGAGHRAAQSPPAAATPRPPSTKPPPSSTASAPGDGRRWPRRSAPASRQATMIPSRRLSGASPTWWPPGRPTPRSPPPCTSVSRPSKPTSPASTANSASAAASSSRAATRAEAERKLSCRRLRRRASQDRADTAAPLPHLAGHLRGSCRGPPAFSRRARAGHDDGAGWENRTDGPGRG